ncbi:hypothetical protein HK101_006941, partial [Irineochytrium annulatum]
MTVFLISFAIILVDFVRLLPFIGGLATYSRAAFGPYIGNVAGQCESAIYTINMALNVVYLAGNITAYGNFVSSDMSYAFLQSIEPLWWALITLLVFVVQLAGPRSFFNILIVLAIFSFSLAPIIVLPDLPKFDFWNNTIMSFYDDCMRYGGTCARNTTNFTDTYTWNENFLAAEQADMLYDQEFFSNTSVYGTVSDTTITTAFVSLSSTCASYDQAEDIWNTNAFNIDSETGLLYIDTVSVPTLEDIWGGEYPVDFNGPWEFNCTAYIAAAAAQDVMYDPPFNNLSNYLMGYWEPVTYNFTLQ